MANPATVEDAAAMAARPAGAPAPAAGTATAVPDWVCCAQCRVLLYRPRIERTQWVCPECGHHGRLSAPQRVELLLDPGSAQALPEPAVPVDPLGFVDTRPYAGRLADARQRTGLSEAVVCARGSIMEQPLVVAVMDFAFLGGSLGTAVGERIVRAAETALAERVPLVLVTASGGARMQEGALALMQMVKTSQALAELDEAGLLTVTLVTDPTYGGVAASFATLGDIVVAEPGARLGFAGPRVIQQTTRQPLPDGFQTAEFLLEHGLVDLVQPRVGIRPLLSRVIGIAADRGRPGTPPARSPVVRSAADLPERDAVEVIALARHEQRPSTMDYAREMLDDFQELHGDRMSADCPAIVAGIGRLAGTSVVFIGHEKGRNLRERAKRNFGMARPEGYRKAARLMRLAAKLGIPVVTLVDTPGADPGAAAEEHGQAVAIAENLRLMSGLPVPIVTVVIGEGGSGGALALGVADRVLAMENAFYSVISPEGCAAILWKSPAATAQAARALRISARELLELGVVDGVVPEPEGGAHRDPLHAVDLVRDAVAGELDELARQYRHDPAELVRARRRRFRRFGA